MIGAGFGRTGTLSLKMALEMLGLGRRYQMFEVRDHPAYAPLWDQVAIFDRYGATVDWPGCWFWRDLLDYYPDAKVVLTIQDPDRWYDSVCKTIYPWLIRDRARATARKFSNAACKGRSDRVPPWRSNRVPVGRVMSAGTFGSREL